MAIVVALEPTFKKLNDDPSLSIKPGGIGREREAVVTITFGASDNYVTGGVTVDFSSTGVNFTQVYTCDITRGHAGHLIELVPGTGNDAATAKLKFYGEIKDDAAGVNTSASALVELDNADTATNNLVLVARIRGI